MAVRRDAPPQVVAQANFGAGMFQSVAPHLIPTDGFRDGVNVLTDEDGSLYGRGGGSVLSASTVAAPARTIWSGTLAGGLRTVFANSADFFVLGAANAVVNLGGSGMSAPGRPVSVHGMLFLPGGAVYAGSRKTVAYSTGTVSVTAGSATVAGAGTAWLADVDAGMLLRLAGRYYAVESVDSDSQVTLTEPYGGTTAAGQSYVLSPLGLMSTAGGIDAQMYATAAGRVVALSGNRAYMSSPDDPFLFNQTEEFHELPAGATLTGGEELGGNLFLFSTHGLWVVTNVAYDLTDAAGNQQQALEPVSRDVVLWDNAGVVSWGGALVVPATDGVWLVSSAGTQRLVRERDGIDPIHALWQGYVTDGDRLGVGAVFRGHYLLPVVSGDGSTLIDLLVCRLAGGPAWTRFAGGSAEVAGLAVQVGTSTRAPKLFGVQVGDASVASVLDVTDWFDPGTGAAVDLAEPLLTARVVLRDVGGPVPSQWKKIRVWYELEGASTDPVMQVGYGTEASAVTETLWGAFLWGVGVWSGSNPVAAWLPDQAAESDGSVEFPALLNVRSRFLRGAVEVSTPRARWVLRAVELFVRPSGRM